MGMTIIMIIFYVVLLGSAFVVGRWLENHEKFITCIFIGLCTFLMSVIGRPANLLILAGTLNGLIIPLILIICLIASEKKEIMGNDYHHPQWMTVTGIISVFLTGGLVIRYILNVFL